MEEEKNEKKGSNRGIIIILLIIIIILMILCVLLATGTLGFKNNNPTPVNSNTENKETNSKRNLPTNEGNSKIETDELPTVDNPVNEDTPESDDATAGIKKYLVNLDCNNSNTTFDGIEVKVEQQRKDMICNLTSMTINGQEIKTDLVSYVKSYEIFDKNVIIISADTSGVLFAIYSTKTNSIIMKLTPEKLDGYWAKSYTTEDNKIIIKAKECGPQCGNASSGYPFATFEIEYNNNSFSEPKLVAKSES